MADRKAHRFRASYLLLLLPFAAMLWVPFYDRAEPTLWGIPFFYWYQLAWIVLGAVLILAVYLIEERAARRDAP